jgi:hypothetical protein
MISRWRRIAVTSEKNVDTTVDAARLEARATKRKVGARIFVARLRLHRLVRHLPLLLIEVQDLPLPIGLDGHRDQDLRAGSGFYV